MHAFSILSNGFWRGLEQYVPYDMFGNLYNALPCLAVYKNIWFISPDNSCIPFHNFEICTNMWRQVYFVYNQKIACLYPQASFSGVLVSARDIYYIDKVVCQGRTKGSSDIIAAAFNYYKIKIIVS